MSKNNDRLLSTALTGGILLIACLILGFNVFQFADRWLNDHMVKTYAAQLAPNPNIVLLDINEESIEKMLHYTYAGSWPWPRSIHGELLEGLAAYKPKAIVFDVFFSEADKHRPDADSYFNEVIAELNNVYFSLLHLNSSNENSGELLKSAPASLGIIATTDAKLEARAHLLLPKAIDQTHWRTGSINFLPDDDGVGRRYDVYREVQGWRIPSLPAKVASDLGAKLPEQASIILLWKGGHAANIKTYSYADIFKAILDNDSKLLSALSDKIIVIGSTASGLHDIRETPISHQYPAVYILATAIDNLLEQEFFSIAEPIFSWLLSAMAILLAISLFWTKLNFKKQFLLSGLFIVSFSILLLVISYLSLRAHIQILIATPIMLGVISYLAFMLSHGLKEHMQRRQAIALFSRFVDPTVVESLIKDGQLDIEKSSQETTLTVLFSDIRGFTTLSEQHSAAEIVTLLNDYFGRQLKIVFNHKGTLDKFIGDCIMAFWGAPISNPNQAIDAVEAALCMADELIAFRQTLPSELQSFDVGIGIHTGPAVVGMIGAQQRVDYTAIGDTVNLASRIEGLTKDKARILVSEDTKIACEQADGDLNFSFKYCGEFKVKGRVEPVQLYEPIRTVK